MSDRTPAAETADRPSVLLVCWRLSRFGGVQIVNRRFIAGMGAHGIPVHVCSLRPFVPEDGVDELTIASAASLGIGGPLTPRNRLAALIEVRRVARRVDPDVLMVMNGLGWLVGLVGLRFRRRIVLEIHDPPSSGRSSGPAYFVDALMVHLLRATVLVHAKEIHQEMVRSWHLAPDRVPISPLAVDSPADTQGPAAPPERIGADEAAPTGRDRPTVLYVARVVPSKRVDVLVEVAHRVRRVIPDVRFIVIGQGSELEPIRADVDRRGLADTVELLGRVEDLEPWYRVADVFCSPSAYEGFGLAVGEAMVRGVPVVVTGVGGIRDLVVDDTVGIKCRLDDVDGLADGVAALLSDPDRARAMGRAARKWVAATYNRTNETAGFRAVIAGITALSDARPTPG